MKNSNVIPFAQVHTLESSGKLRRQKATTSPTTSPITTHYNPSDDTRAYFAYRGREWRIYRRGNAGAWYLSVEHHGQRYVHSCGQVDKKTAVTTAKIKIDAILDGHLETLRASMMRGPAPEKPLATIGDIIRVFERTPLDVQSTTVTHYVHCFRNVLRTALAIEDDAAIDALSSAVLCADTVAAYYEHAIARARAAADQKEMARRRRSANSIFQNARPLLRPKLLGVYRRAGLQLPDVQPFIDAHQEEKFGGTTTVAYDPPPEKIIRATLHAWLRMENRNDVIAVGLMLSCGLRKEEVQQVTWGMFTRSHGSPLLDGRGHVKNQSGEFVVPPIDPFWTLLLRRIDREGWRGKPEDLVLIGTPTEVSDYTFRRISDWMAGLGWTTQKKSHAFRALAGSYVAMKYGIYRCSAWLRHSSIKVTEGHYKHFIDGRVFNPARVPIRWAR